MTKYTPNGKTNEKHVSEAQVRKLFESPPRMSGRERWGVQAQEPHRPQKSMVTGSCLFPQQGREGWSGGG